MVYISWSESLYAFEYGAPIIGFNHRPAVIELHKVVLGLSRKNSKTRLILKKEMVGGGARLFAPNLTFFKRQNRPKICYIRSGTEVCIYIKFMKAHCGPVLYPVN